MYLFKTFFAEFIFSLLIFIQLLTNSRLVKNLNFNFAILDREAYAQTSFALIAVFLALWSNLFVDFSEFGEAQLFLNSKGICMVKLFFIGSCLILLPTISRAHILEKLNFSEFYIIFQFWILASLFLISSNDLLPTYILLELQALSLFVLASYKTDSVFSSEAGLKYFIAGAFISGIFLLGCSLIYGSIGTLNFDLMVPLIMEGDSTLLNGNAIFSKTVFSVGILLVVVTLMFKVGAAPVHFWLPDVYDGAPLPSTIIFTILPKTPLFCFFIRIVSLLAIEDYFRELDVLFAFVGLFSIVFGTFFALRQTRVKRIFIFSSIAQVGFLFACFSLFDKGALSTVLFFLFIYTLTMTFIWNTFVLVADFASKSIEISYKNENIPLNVVSSVYVTDFAKFWGKNVVWSVMLVIAMFSLAGIPPFAGFWAKALVIIRLAIQNQYMVAGFFMIVGLFSAFYYLRFVKIILFETKAKNSNKESSVFKYLIEGKPLEFTINCLILAFLMLAFFSPDIILPLAQEIIEDLIK